MARKIGRLNAVSVRNAKAGMHADGGGLYLQVTNSGAKSWLFRYSVGERERYCGLGSLSTASLQAARSEAQKCRQMRLQGVDPIEARKAGRAAAALSASRGTTFKEAAETLIRSRSDGWKNAKHAHQWRRTLEVYAFPVLGSLPVDGVTTDHVMKVLEPIWLDKPETASRVRGRIEAVLDSAKARGIRDGENPARWHGHLDHLLPSRAKVRKVKHFAALPYVEIGAFTRKLRERGGIASQALEFLILTCARTSEVAGMREREIELKSATWTVPAERMKAGIEHVVPLTSRAVAILRARQTGDPDALIFPGTKGRPISDMTLTMVHRRLGYKITTHGFRSTFRDWAGDCTRCPRDVAEMCLAHAVGDAVEQAYRRGTALEKRRMLLDEWTKYCETAAHGKVIPLKTAS